MMSNIPDTHTQKLIKINSCTSDEIAQLHGIGPKLAQRIIEHRNQHGFYRSLEDLTKVKGISINFATTLTPLIDWQIPDAENQQSNHELVLIGILLFAFQIYLYITTTVDDVIALSRIPFDMDSWISATSITGINVTIPLWLAYWQTITFSVMQFSFGLFALFFGIPSGRHSTRNPITRSMLWLTSGVLSMLLLGVGYFIQVFYTTGGLFGFLSLWGNLGVIVGLGALFFILNYATPAYVLYFGINGKNLRILSRISDIVFIITSPLMGLVAWTHRSVLPVLAQVIFGVFGLGLIGGGIYLLTNHISFFEVMIEFINSIRTVENLEEVRNSEAWLVWVNSRIPNPEDQKALRDVLNTTHPPSKWRTVGYIVVVVGGGWLLTTALSSIIDWIIQGWLNNFIQLPW